MKFLKQKSLSKFSLTDQTFFTNHYGRAVMNLTGGLRLPSGDTSQRPDPTNGRWPGVPATQLDDEYADGTIRYNTETNSIEALMAGRWEIIRSTAASTITKQQLGPGDYTETVFGPLLSDERYLNAYSASDHNIIVLVENVFQISDENFTVEQSVSGSLTGPNAPYADGWYVKFTSPVPLDKKVTIYYGYSN